MKVAFIADIHGNLPALKKVLETCTRLGVSEIHCLGDTMGYFPDVEAVLSLLQKEAIPCQQGNHEAMWLQPNTQAEKNETVYRLQAHGNALPFHYREWISSWPTEKKLTWETSSKSALKNTVWLIHGSPDDPLFGYVYPDTDLTPWQELPYQAVLMANTHRPFIRQSGLVTFVNTGSVGLPRDSGNMASFALFDTALFLWDIIRVSLDTDELKQAYGNYIHESVLKCLDRTTPDLIGTVFS